MVSWRPPSPGFRALSPIRNELHFRFGAKPMTTLAQVRLVSRNGATKIVAPTMPALNQRDEATLAGVAGLEPATPGFGDRCSTN
jgi:hypothetical protein